MNRKIKNLTHGFTLIELLIVIAIIGVLTSVLLIAVDPIAQLQKSRDGQRKSDIRQIQSALELYRSDKSGYITGSDLSPLTTGTKYMSQLPKDPTKNVVYSYLGTADNYTLSACLERPYDSTDPNQTPSAPNGWAGACTSINWFKVTNP